MTIQQWLETAAQRLAHVGITSARLDAEILLAHTLTHERTWLIAHADTTLSSTDIASAEALLHRRLQREPLAYIRGYIEFYERTFSVTPSVLIPRPESETIISLLRDLPEAQHGHLVDVGTGSGCLGLTASLTFPTFERIILSDISPEALATAEKNRHTLVPHDQRISLQQSDLLRDIPSPITTIVANLPYVDAAWHRSPETQHEPSLALFAKDNGIALITTLITQAAAALTTGGFLILEADPQQHDAIIADAREYHFSMLRIQDFIVVLQKQ